jgi:beta-galactosidase GanA
MLHIVETKLTQANFRSLGFNAISAYFFWGIHEPKRGELSFEGFRDLQPFFDAAMKAGLYVIARPGFVLARLAISFN